MHHASALLFFIALFGGASSGKAEQKSNATTTVEKLRKWLDGMTAEEYAVSGDGVQTALSEVESSFRGKEAAGLSAIRKQFRMASKPHTQIALINLAHDLDPERSFSFVAGRAAKRKLDPKVRQTALLLAGSVPGKRTRVLLRTFCFDPDGQMRKIAAWKLLEAGKDAWNHLGLMMKSSDPFIRWGTALALASWNPTLLAQEKELKLGVMIPGVFEWMIREEFFWAAQWLPRAAMNLCRANSAGPDTYQKLGLSLIQALAKTGTSKEKAYYLMTAGLQLIQDKRLTDPMARKRILAVFAACYGKSDADGVKIEEGLIPWKAILGILHVASTGPWTQFRPLNDQAAFSNARLREHLASFQKGILAQKTSKKVRNQLRRQTVLILAGRRSADAPQLLRKEILHGGSDRLVERLLEFDKESGTAEFLLNGSRNTSLDIQTRLSCLTGFAIAAPKKALPYLQERLQESNPKIRERAARLIGYIGSFTRQLRKANSIVKEAADKETIPRVSRALLIAQRVLKADPFAGKDSPGRVDLIDLMRYTELD